MFLSTSRGLFAGVLLSNPEPAAFAFERGALARAELEHELKRARIQASVDAYGYAIELDRLTGTVPRSAATLSAPKQ